MADLTLYTATVLGVALLLVVALEREARRNRRRTTIQIWTVPLTADLSSWNTEMADFGIRAAAAGSAMAALGRAMQAAIEAEARAACQRLVVDVDRLTVSVDPAGADPLGALLAWHDARGLAAVTVVADDPSTLAAGHDATFRVDDEWFEYFLPRHVLSPPSAFETHPTSPRVGDVSYGHVPEGCWRTVDDAGAYRACNAPADDDLGLCSGHAAELRSTA